MVTGIKAAAASVHSAEDSGKEAGLPGLNDHDDLHAAEGKRAKITPACTLMVKRMRTQRCVGFFCPRLPCSGRRCVCAL